MSGSTKARRAGSGFGTIALRIYGVLGFVYLFLPIFWIVAFSFNKPKGRYNLTWQQFTLDNWADPFSDTEMTDAFVKSLQIAGASVLLATIMGGMMALALSKYRFKGGSAVDILLVIPLTTPEIVLGASLFTLFLDWSFDFGFITVMIAHTLFCLSFVAMTVKARIRGFDWNLEDAAMDLGAGPWRTFSRVTLPLIIPGVMAAALLSFALSIDDYIITSFTAGEMRTFPLQIFDRFRVSFLPNINVLATMILVVSVAALTLVSLRDRRSA